MGTRRDDLHVLAPRAEVTRRDALKLLAAGIAALESGCLSRAGDEAIVPYVGEPPEHRPGVPVTYASALALDGFAYGVLVATRDGRPIKIDGNPAHPASAGGSTPWMQARILDLYDPQRSRAIRASGDLVDWPQLARRLANLPGPLWLVMPPQSSPTVAALLDRIRAQRELHVVTEAPIDRRNAYRGTELVFGRALELQPELGGADAIVALDADPCAYPGWARAIASRRAHDRRMNRIWACEPVPTPTGMLADERLALPAGDIASAAACLAAELGAPIPAEVLALARSRLGFRIAWIRTAAEDLARHGGIVLVGDRQPPIVHAMARWIDHAVRAPASLTPPVLIAPDATLSDLARAAPVATIVVDCDPLYTAPDRTALTTALAAAPLSLHVGLYENRTSAACQIHAPLAHELEAWSDVRAADGTRSIVQPTIRPLFGAVSLIELLSAIAGETRDARALVRGAMSEDAWTTALRTGVVPDSQLPPVAVTPRWTAEMSAQLARACVPAVPETIEIALAASPALHDGRFAPNAWLQELPHPITKQTWGNAALMSRATAASLGVTDEDRVTLATAAGTLLLPALIVDGAADDTITVELGYGQLASTPIAARVGGDAYALRGEATAILQGIARRGRGTERIVRTQLTMTTEGREIAPIVTQGQLAAMPELLAKLRGDQPSLLPPQERDGVQWGMSIDTSICTGCSACMVACQAENNIPTVGPDEVARGRHMNWIRIDRYITDDGVVNEPMPCQHCEHAPCEYVCPVMATTHSPDGLNEQIYNRCVGTRFCSNNCPYKVRRFNWFANETHSTRALQYNPDVTVRSRGVMEKCTYCVQRIRRAEHTALVEKRAIRAGEVATACQQACPTGAIQFGQLHEDGTPFAQLRRDPRRFDVLHELGTRPRTQYLAKIVNPKGES